MTSSIELTSQQIKLAILSWLKDKPYGDDKYNIIGRVDAPVGAIETKLLGSSIRFNAEQRHLASICFDELRAADFIRSTHGSNSRPDDYVVITESGLSALESGLEESSENDSTLPKHGVDVAAKYIFLDIVGFTRNRKTEAQADIVKQLNIVVNEAVKSQSISEDKVIFIPTGDGICIVLLSVEHPVDIHIKIALDILKNLDAYNTSMPDVTRQFQVRIGINAHPDILVVDINNRQNIAGVGISTASRIMGLADGGHIVVGHSVYSALQSREKYDSAFRSYKATVKHGDVLDIYQLIKQGYKGLNVDELRISEPAKAEFSPKAYEAISPATTINQTEDDFDQYYRDIQFQDRYEHWRTSEDGVASARQEMEELHEELKQLVQQQNAKLFTELSDDDPSILEFAFSREGADRFLLHCRGVCLFITWDCKFANSLDGSVLLVEGYRCSFDVDGHLGYSEQDRNYFTEYDLEMDREARVGWRNRSFREHLQTSGELARDLFRYVLGVIRRNNQK